MVSEMEKICSIIKSIDKKTESHTKTILNEHAHSPFLYIYNWSATYAVFKLDDKIYIWRRMPVRFIRYAHKFTLEFFSHGRTHTIDTQDERWEQTVCFSIFISFLPFLFPF